MGSVGAAALVASASAKGLGAQKTGELHPFGFVIHGGAGTIERSRMTPERERAYREKLTEALLAGYEVLKKGGASLDAVVAAITLMEDSPLFNAGKGAVFTNAGTNELDTSIMEGRTLKAGAAAGLKRVKNPILLARLVMEQSPHVMMTGEGAEAFAAQKGLELVDPKYFYTEERWQQLQKVKDEEKSPPPKQSKLEQGRQPFDEHKFGTVGAVALDRAGNLGAGTSTGGMTNKRFGRVGDSPIIRASVAHEVSARMRYAGESVERAAAAALEKARKLGGTGGLIALDRRGNFTMPFNTSGMYRGVVGADGRPRASIYKD